MPDIILHHYGWSPVAEKIRVGFGLKGLHWRSVEVPSVMPKPDLMPLTGGYRRVPVMQIGADIYCDTQLILAELEWRFPEPSFFPAGNKGLTMALAMWAERSLFTAATNIAFDNILRTKPDFIPKDLLADRQALFKGAPSRIMPGFASSMPHMRDQIRAACALMSDQLADGRLYLTGNKPGLADLQFYFNMWWIATGAPDEAESLLKPYQNIRDWMVRMEQIGHGSFDEMDSQTALDIARAATPQTPEKIDDEDPNGRRPGDQVWVMPDDYGRNPVRGRLLASSADRIALACHNDTIGDHVIHFPRTNYLVGDKSIEDKVDFADPTL